VELRLECGESCGAAVPIEEQLRAAPAGEWRSFKILLQCFQQHGADMRRITAPFALTTNGALSMGIANVRLETGLTEAQACH
jgi:beta-glucosidase